MFLLKIRNNRETRFVAFFLAINILAEIISPSVAFALTSGPSQPEVESFTPINTSEMVDLFSGDFKYNIPLMDVGGYPLNINYNSGIGMDQEASWTGLGWNLNCGAITRSMRGLPDDFAGIDAIKKEINMKDNESYGGNIKLGVEVFGWGKSGSSGQNTSGLTLSAGIAINYNNYSGIGVTQSFGANLGLSAGKGSSGKMNAGFGMSSSAAEGLDINHSVSYSAKLDDKDKNDNNSSNLSIGLGMGINSRSGLKQLSLSASYAYSETKKQTEGKYKDKLMDTGNSGSSGSSGAVNFGVSTHVPSIQFPMTTNAVALSFKLGTTVFGLDGSVNVGGYYSNQHLSTREMSLPSYGYLYSHLGQDNDYALMDFNREKDGGYNRTMQKLPITNFSYDVYNIAGQGVGGTYRPFRHDIGHVFDNEAQTTSDSYTLGGEVDLAQTVHAGIDISVVDVNTVVGKWKDMNNAKSAFRFSSSNPNVPLDEVVSFKEVGEKSVDEDMTLFDDIGGFSAARIKLNDPKMSASADQSIELYHPSGGLLTTKSVPASLKRSKRNKRNQVISTLTYKEAADFGLEKSLYTSITGAKPHHIAEVTVLKTDGSRYVYGLPAYNTEQIESTFNVTGNSRSGLDFKNGLIGYGGSDDSNGNSKGNDHYFNRVTTPAYAHAYMLTGVVSSDYVDSDNIPGPSDGDLGNYTKFEYQKVGDYDWRTPIGANKANYNENTKSAAIGDDYGSYVSGKKDMYYVSKIITKNYIAIFETAPREDALGAANTGAASTADRSMLLKKITLYSKPEYQKQQNLGVNVFRAVPIKVVNFVYNYELCKNVPNNSGANISGDHYYTDANGNQINAKGKLTLKQIYFTYGTSDKAKLNTYDFNYDAGTAAHNPDYDPKAYDRWGNYKPNTITSSSDAIALSNKLPNWEFPYTDQSSQTNADNNSSAWSLTQITLPSGADINVQYESDDYAFVQNLPAMNMCKVTNVTENLPDNSVVNGNMIENLQTGMPGNPKRYLVFELPKPISKLVVNETPNYFKDNYIKDMESGRYMYFRFLINMTRQGNSISQNRGDYFEYVSGYAELDNTEYNFIDNGNGNANFTHGYVKLKDVKIKKIGGITVNPIAKAAWQMGRVQFPNLVWDASFNPNGGPADIVKALIKSDFTQNIIDGIKGPNLAIASKGYGIETVMNKSWIRLYNPDGKKFGGGCRVKQLTINDNWDDMTKEGALNQSDFTYGQTYQYTTEENGRVISSGVAAYEPMIGGDEIPHRLPNYYTHQGSDNEVMSFLIPSDQFFTEEPYGESFFPAASVGYSKVKVANLKREDASGNKIVKAHATGHVIHKFYTAKDYPTITSRTNIDKKPFKPKFAGLTKIFARDFMTVSQGHLVEVNDMHGKPRGMEVYAEDKYDQPLSTVEYKYKTQGANGFEDPSQGDLYKNARYKANRLLNKCVTIKPDGTINESQIGVDYDMVADFRESQTTTVMGGAQINLSAFLVGVFPGIVPTIWPDFSRDVSRFRSAVTTKVIYRYGILEKTIATDLGSKVETSNLAYDSETGEVLLTKTQNNFEDQIYSFTYPAHWTYDLMGLAYKNIGAKVFNVNFNSAGLATLAGGIANPFVTGDEVMLGSNKGWVCSVAGQNFSVIDKNGNPVTGAYSTVTILRSGRRNQQSTPVGSIVSLANPIDIDANGSLDASISFGNNPSQSKIIKTGAVEYSDVWQLYPGFKEGTEGTCQCTATQQGIDMYNTMKTLVINNLFYNTTGLGTKLYDASSNTLYNSFTNNLLLPNGSGCTYTGINLNDHYWHVNPSNNLPNSNIAEFDIRGTYDGTPITSGSSWNPSDFINCGQRCFVKAELPSGMQWGQIRLISINSYSVVSNLSNCTGQLQICASYAPNVGSRVGETDSSSGVNSIVITPPSICFTITPGGKCYDFVNCTSTPSSQTVCPPNLNDKVNPYYVGIRGNWRMVSSWSYLSDRTQNLVGSASTKNTDIRNDGVLLTKDKITGASIAYQPFWKNNGSGFVKDDNYWTFTSQVTKYSPNGMELENKDALQRYSSALYGYNESLPLAVASNSKYQEIAYDGFEDYDFINPTDCKKKHFNFYENKAKLSPTESHTGLYSMEVNNATTVKSKRKLPTNISGVPNNCAYLLGSDDFLPLFSPTPKKYVLSYWVKEIDYAGAPTTPILNYTNSTISISLPNGPATLNQIVKSSIIDGWQRVECTFDVTSGLAGDIEVSLNNTSSSTSVKTYFDDIRIHPFEGSLKSFVYNPVTLKYVAELDANNFATFYEYNEEGSLIRVKKETERGIMTIQETKNHTKRKL